MQNRDSKPSRAHYHGAGDSPCGPASRPQFLPTADLPGDDYTADFNGENAADGNDLATLEASSGTSNDGGDTDSDTDSDGDSDGADFLAWQRQYTGPLSTSQSLRLLASWCWGWQCWGAAVQIMDRIYD